MIKELKLWLYYNKPRIQTYAHMYYIRWRDYEWIIPRNNFY